MQILMEPRRQKWGKRWGGNISKGTNAVQQHGIHMCTSTIMAYTCVHLQLWDTHVYIYNYDIHMCTSSIMIYTCIYLQLWDTFHLNSTVDSSHTLDAPTHTIPFMQSDKRQMNTNQPMYMYMSLLLLCTPVTKHAKNTQTY